MKSSKINSLSFRILSIGIYSLGVMILIPSCDKIESTTNPSSANRGIQVSGIPSVTWCNKFNQCCGCGDCTIPAKSISEAYSPIQDEMIGYSKASLLGQDTVLVTNTFDKTNLTASTFDKVIQEKSYTVKQDDGYSIRPELLKEVYANAKIEGFPTNVELKPQLVLTKVIGSPTNNKFIYQSRYFISKNGQVRREQTITVK